MTPYLDDKEPKDQTTPDGGENEAPAEVFLDPWLDHVDKPEKPKKAQAATRTKGPRAAKKAAETTLAATTLGETRPERTKGAGTKAAKTKSPAVTPAGKTPAGTTLEAKKPAPKKAAPLAVKSEPPEEKQVRPLGETDDFSEAELIRQAGLFFWRGASPRGREKILGASRARRTKLGQTAAEYLVTLRRNPGEWDEIWDLVDSDREDSFFRFPAQFDLLAELLAERAVLATDRESRFLSAGCGPGFEAYSLSMFLRGQRLAGKGWDLSIDAFDLSEKLISRARLGNFKAGDLEWLRPEAAKRWFALRAAGWHFKEELGVKVEFFTHNPAEGEGEKRSKFLGAYDVIFCRGMSFDCPDHRVKHLAREMAAMLAPGGLLFTAPGEIWPEVAGLALEERDGVIYGRNVGFEQKAKKNVFFRGAKKKSRPKADGLSKAGGVSEVGGLGKADGLGPGGLKAHPGRESLISRYHETIGVNPDAAREVVLEILALDQQRLLVDPEILGLMAEVERVLGREESAAAIETVLNKA
ncbi:MAG: methyltransferase domain-containing protein [Deltaproteobacteria bacterium]|jgi:chemotaxis methyl-accepting protein methylase|nr:methyltransferase domain-containing protein [Deltaproteobacteria bacterium]